MFSTDDTIAAIATPHGRGGIGVVRLSGPEAARIAGTLLGLPEGTSLEPRHATFARVIDPAAGPAPIDQVVATFFQAPHSYTGDDVVEVSAHGSPVLLARIVAIAAALGARLAEPGEFTFRAYLAGRIDLIQAEAVADLADAVTPLQARAAMDQLEGTLTGAIAAVDATLLDLTARLEASLDFPDEGFHFVTREDAARALAAVAEALADLVRRGQTGRLVRDGRTVVLLGRPNAGKSSLFNALAGAERAIVTPIAGTTRDLVTERIDMRGVPVTLVDTAGLGDAADPIEAEGVRRARQAGDVAALTALILDASQPWCATEELVTDATGPCVLVVNKIDLPRAWPSSILADFGAPVVEVSAETGAGLDALRDALTSELASREPVRDAPLISNVRHLDLVARALDAVRRGMTSLAGGATEELVVADLIAARRCLEELTGRRTPEDVLRHIFTRFCVGK